MNIEINQRRALRAQRIFQDAEAVIETLPDGVQKIALRALIKQGHLFTNVLYREAGGTFTDDAAQVAATDLASPSPVLSAGSGGKDE